MRHFISGRLIAATLLLAASSFGYVRQTAQCPPIVLPANCPTTPIYLVRTDNTAIQFYLNNLVVPSTAANKTPIASDANPPSAIQAALNSWNSITTANVHFLPLRTTTKLIDQNDNQHTIAFGVTPADLSFVNGAVAVTVDFYGLDTSTTAGVTIVCLTRCPDYPGGIVDSDIILNPAMNFTSNGTGVDIQAALLHELGHALSANHSNLLGATMFQTATIAGRYLSADDLAFVNAAYPSSTPQAFGTVSGTVTVSGTPVPYALLTFIDPSENGLTLGGVTGADGTYSVQVPPGSYILYAEPINALLPINIYLSAEQLSLTKGFQATFLGGASSPTALRVSAGETLSGNNIAANGAATTLGTPYLALVPTGGTVLSYYPLSAPLIAPSGQTVDLLFGGNGFDASSIVKVYGGGVTAGAVNKTNIVLGGITIYRCTLTIKERQTHTLASMLVTAGGSTLSMSGILSISPVSAPVTSSAGVVNAASFKTPGSVAPGEMVTVFGSGLGVSTIAFADLNDNNIISKYTADTRILFDGVPAPMIYTQAGQVTVMVPYAVSGHATTSMVVEYLGVPSTAVTLNVVATVPALFQIPGTTFAAALNDDSITPNSASSGEPVGGVIVLYGTGEGQTIPAGVDGQRAVSTLPKPVANVSVTIGGKTAVVQYAGTAPGFTGLLQVNASIPAGLASGPQPVILTVGGVAAPTLNINVK